MQIERFTEYKTGELIPITVRDGLSDFAFAPQTLPPSWQPDTSLWPLITEARDRVSTLNGIGCTLPNPTLLLRPLQRREAIKSNSIEGTFVTAEELLLFEATAEEDTVTNRPRLNDWIEVRRYDRTISHGCEKIGQGAALDQNLICELHEMLLKNTRGRNKNPGQFRDIQVYVEAGRRFIPPPYDRIGELIADLEKYHTATDCDPLVRAFIAHYQFEAIHPFADGNGRIGRLLLSLSIYKWLNHSHAWLYLSDFFDKNRREYIERLFAVSTDGEWDEWVKFCLLGVIEQAQDSIARCRKINDVKKEYESSIGHTGARITSIITTLLSNPIIEIVDIQKRFDISYHTAKADINKLLLAGILEELSHHRPKAFVARAIYNAAYVD